MSGKKKILLVDDDAKRSCPTSSSSSPSTTTWSAPPTRTQVVAMAREAEQPDLILCDIDMPDMSGGDRGAPP
jgi:CheY-like chemotaxis protein